MTRKLQARGITVRFSGVVAVEGVSLELNQGEIYGLIGPNGAGKTTFLNVISGFLAPTTGSVSIDEGDVTRWSASRRARAGLVRTFQGTRIFPSFTVFENVELAALGMGLTARDARVRAAEVLEVFGLAGKAAQVAKTLPQGTERLVGLARAIATRPDFLLLDEPAAGLDETESAQLGANLELVRGTFGAGILLVEHDVNLVMTVCDRIHVLQMGRTIADSTPEDVAADDRVREAYLGTRGREAGADA